MTAGTTVAVCGGGQIGEALLGGLVAAGRAGSSLSFVEPDAARAGEVSARHGVEAVTLEQAVGADVVVVAVKPHHVAGLLGEVAARLRDTGRAAPLVVSLAAGIPTVELERPLPEGTRVVRVMPNTPMLVGRAMCVLSPGRHAGDDALGEVEELLAAVGRTVRVPEAQQDVATALSGSGPAYVFLLAEAMVEAGVGLGLPRTTATELVAATVEGAGTLLTSGTVGHPALLRESVTSPGGTTAAAVRVLEAHGLRTALADAVSAARDRSLALGEQYGNGRSS